MPSFSRALHMALTVRDMRASAGWYQRVHAGSAVMHGHRRSAGHGMDSADRDVLRAARSETAGVGIRRA
jgi:hypothetical protein